MPLTVLFNRPGELAAFKLVRRVSTSAIFIFDQGVGRLPDYNVADLVLKVVNIGSPKVVLEGKALFECHGYLEAFADFTEIFRSGGSTRRMRCNEFLHISNGIPIKSREIVFGKTILGG